MTTDEDEGVRLDKAREPEPSEPSDPSGLSEGPRVRFWHRDHPVFAPLTGFFTGFLLVILALVALGSLLQEVFEYDVTAHPWILLVAVAAVLLVNVVLLVLPRSRRFARYMLFGVLATPLVILGVAALTTFLLIRSDG